MDDKLFDSYTNPIPPFRRDVQVIPVEQNGEDFLYFYDAMGYTTPNFAVPSSARSIFSLFDGKKSVEDIMRFSSEKITKERVLSYVRFLDENSLLYSPYFKAHSELVESEYEKSKIHQSNTAGVSYPEDKKELKTFFDEAFSKLETTEPVSKAKALYAPHIDLRVGMNSYVKAFSSIRDLKPKRVFILATSHYSGLHPDIYETRPFVISDKDFHMVNGVVKSDKEAIRRIADKVRNGADSKGKASTNGHSASMPSPTKAGPEAYGITFQDRAHRVEHSIELHLLFLNYLWNHEFRIVPIVAGSLDELFYMKDGHQGKQVDKFSELLRNLFGNDDETFFLISGDLAHIGKKFGDRQPAKEMFEDIRSFDTGFLKSGSQADPEMMLELMSREYDPYRICGYPPLYSFLNTFPGEKGKILTYDIWDEKERESAVSFGSILF